jgi:hypothetical protein
MAGLSGRQTKEQEQRDELLSAYLDGQLSAGERARLEAGLATDPAVQADLEALRRTVALVRDLPSMPVPYNFILPQAATARPRPMPSLRPRRAWAAPLLTAATAVASFLFVIVLAGDLLFFGTGRLTLAPEAAPQEIPEAAMEYAGPIEETKEVEKAVSVEEAEAEEVQPPAAVSTATPPLPMMEAPIEAAPEATVEAEGYEEEKAVEAPAPAIGGGPTEGPPIPAEPCCEPTMETAAPTEEGRGAEPTLGTEAAVAPLGGDEEASEADAVTEERGPREGERTNIALITPWRVLEIALGLIALGLALTTVLAWRARRR